MKQNFKITFCAMLASLAAAFMLLSYFPYLTYAIPAISGLFIMIAVIEINVKWATLAYLASAVLVFLFAEPESKLMYICFFGFYPIIKALAEKIRNQIIEWVTKLGLFNISMITIYVLLASLFSISVDDFGEFGKYGALAFLGLGNVVFFVYDIAISRISMTYIRILHPRVKKLFKNLP